jgi:hypothetical protein
MGYRSDIDAQQGGLSSLQAQIDALSAKYAIKYDQDADPPTLAYLGEAAPGASAAGAVWRIQKLVFSVDGDVTSTWADGNANFDNVWNNRTGLTYS